MKKLISQLTTAFIVSLLVAAMPTTARSQAIDLNALAARGEAIANQDPLAVELRNRESEGARRRGFDIGMAAAEGNTLPGPGKQRIHDSLPQAEQSGFTTAVAFSLERNRNADFAAKGAIIALADPLVAAARLADGDVFYWLGFDIATGIFGDPALGARGNTATGPGSLRIRDSLSAAGQRGFNGAVKLHLSRNYRLPPQNTQVVPVAKTPTPKQFDLIKPLPDSATQVVPYQSQNPAGDRARVEEFSQLRGPPRPYIAAVWQPLFEQVEVFAIDARGVLKGVFKHHNGFWEASFNLSAPALAPAGAPLAAVWQPLNEQLEVFTIGRNGALTDTWKAHNGRWFAPIYLTPPNFAPPGAHVAAVFQPLNNQLEVFAIDATGAVRLKWKAQNGEWQGPVTLTQPGMALPGAPITAVWQPLNEKLEVFWIDTTGAMREIKKEHNGSWKERNGDWQTPAYLTTPGFAGPHAKVAAIWQPLNEQLEVFVVDRTGAIKDIWKAHDSAWKGPTTLDGPGVALPGAAIVALWDQPNEMLQVITVTPKGEVIDAYKTHNGVWKPGPGAFAIELAPAGAGGSLPAGVALAGVVEPVPNDSLRQVFTIDDNQAVRVIFADGLHARSTSPPVTRANFGPIYGAHAAACSAILKSWSLGDGGNESGLEACIDFMGIRAHCDRQDAFVSVGHPPQAMRPRFLQCSSRSHPGTVVEDVAHIARGVAQGVADAAIATVVYSPEIVQGTACVYGVVFACATLAVDLASRAGVVPDEIKDAVDLAVDASGCVDGDVVSCAKLTAAGARAVGVKIPGEDAGQVALMSQQCANGDYGACLRLGEKAAGAAGVPVGAINQAAKNAQDCYAGSADGCIALGRQAAQAGIPIGGVVDGASNMRQCSLGSLADCQQLGEALAAVPL